MQGESFPLQGRFENHYLNYQLTASDHEIWTKGNDDSDLLEVSMDAGYVICIYVTISRVGMSI